MSQQTILALSPAGPVADAFTKSQAFISAIMGPVGSAKTTHCIQKCLWAALWQNPGPDGVRRAKVAVIRDTYPNLIATTLASWWRWFPKELGRWSGEPPFMHTISLGLHRAGDVQLTMIFVAIGDKRVEDVLRGLEVTAAWLNEADRLNPEVLRFLQGRVGRYPGSLEGGCAWSGIFMDFNAPDVDNWTYKLLVDRELPEGMDAGDIEFFRQPSGLSPQAENLTNLPPRYYERQMIGNSPDYIRRMIRNEFGAVRNGMPVYPEFQDNLHVAASDLQPVKGIPLRIAADAGLTPAAVIGQRMANGQLRVLDELAVFLEEDEELHGVGPTRFGRALADLLDSRYPGMPVLLASCDPTAKDGTDGSGNEASWMQIVSKTSGVRFQAAPTNDPTIRMEAVRRPLLRLLEGGQPGLLISPRCKILRRGFNSGYVFRRTAMQGGDGRYENKPVKNQYSHVHDALQYFTCSAGEAREVMGVKAREGRVQVHADSDYDMYGDAA